MRKIASACLNLSLIASLLPFSALPVHAQESAGSATVDIDQHNTGGIIGHWTLIMPGSVEKVGDSASTSLTNLVMGTYTIFAEAPKGANTTIRRYLGSTLLETLERGQMSFMVQEGENIHISIHYTFVRIGTVTVHSDPPGVAFTMTGPNDMNIAATTPMTYDSLPEGQYAVQYQPLPGCATPPRQAHMLQENSRITFDVTLACKSADILREREKSPEEEEYVTIVIDGEEVTLRDVQQTMWYAPFVFRAAKLNVVSGYRGEDGKPTGEFGPDRPVTIAELAKIAQNAAGLSIDSDIQPENSRAKYTWAAPYFSFAEQNGWTVYVDGTVDPERPATRAEVVVTLLQAMDIPLRWAKGGMFTDVSARTALAAAVETAAGDGIVGGYVDEAGELTGAFGPNDPVTRAQVAKIFVTAIDTYRLDTDGK